MKILIIEPVSDLGGVSQYILSMLRRMDANKDEFIVGASTAGPLFLKLDAIGVKSVILPVDFHSFGILQSIYTLRLYIRENQIDVVHAHTTKAGVLGALATIGIANTKFIFSSHGWRFKQVNFFKSVLFYFIAKFICIRAWKVVTVNKSEYHVGIKYKLLTNKKVVVAPIQIDTSIFKYKGDDVKRNVRNKLHIPDDALVVGITASMVKEKDPAFFVQVCSILSKKSERFHFLWIGDGILRDKITDHVKFLNLENRFHCTGFLGVDKITDYLSTMDIFFLSSKIEVFPISLLEAMATGIICVAPAFEGIIEIIQNGTTGLLYSDRNPYAVAEIIYQNIDSKYLGNNAQNFLIANYSNLDSSRDLYSEIYSIK